MLSTRGHYTSLFTCPTDSGNCPFIPERISEVSHGKHLKEKAVFTFRKQKVDKKKFSYCETENDLSGNI